MFARRFGKLIGLREPDDPFAAALLQDMAVPLLAKELSEEYTALLEAREGGKTRLSQLERERFGWTHATAAAQMARQWNLPDEFAALIERHTEIDVLMNERAPNGAEIAVAMSSLLPAVSDELWPDLSRFEGYLRQTAPADVSTLTLLEAIDAEFADFAPLLKITAPEKSLATRYQEAICREHL